MLGSTILTLNRFYNWSVLLCHLQKNPSFLHHLLSRPLLITGKSGNCFHTVNIMSNVVSCGNSLKKNEKVNKIRIRNRQGRWALFLDLWRKFKKEETFIYVKTFPSWSITYYLSCIIAMENFAILLFTL